MTKEKLVKPILKIDEDALDDWELRNAGYDRE